MDNKAVEDLQLKIRGFDVEISKHRKLLHRAIGNNCIVSINWHHMNIVSLINEKKQHESDLMVYFKPLINFSTEKNLFKILDDLIINGTNDKD